MTTHASRTGIHALSAPCILEPFLPVLRKRHWCNGPACCSLGRLRSVKSELQACNAELEALVAELSVRGAGVAADAVQLRQAMDEAYAILRRVARAGSLRNALQLHTPRQVAGAHWLCTDPEPHVAASQSRCPPNAP